MSIQEELQELYDQKEKITQNIEIERAERNYQGSNGRVQDVRISLERERRLKDKLNEVNIKIAKLESKQNQGMVRFGTSAQSEFLNGIDENSITEGLLQDLGIDPNSNQEIEITNTTTIKVTEDLDDGYKNVQQVTKGTTEQLQFDGGKQVLHDKHGKIEFILQELKNGVEINKAIKQINVSVNDVNKWLEEGKKGIDSESTMFYEEVKQIESSKSSDDIEISVKKVDDIKKPKINKQDISHITDDERKKMQIVLDCLKKGYGYDEAAENAGISPNLITTWRKNGLNKVNENSINFYNELINFELNKKDSIEFAPYISRKSNSKSSINKFSSKFNHNSYYIIPNNVNKTSISKRESNEQIPKISKSDSRKIMAEIISLMKEGYGRKLAIEKVNISYDLFREWYNDGSKNRDRYARNFFKQIKSIEKNNF